jgi:hypothetical protein
LNCSNCLVNTTRFGDFIAHLVMVVRTRHASFGAGTALVRDLGYRTSQNSTLTYASTYQSIKHSFNSCLPQDVILKYTQSCTSVTVDRRFCTVSKCQKDDYTNPGSQRLALLISMLPMIQRHQKLSLRYCLCKTAQQGTVQKLYRGLRQLVCLVDMVKFMQIRNHTRGRFITRFRLL